MTTFTSGSEMKRAGTRLVPESAEEQEQEGLSAYSNPESVFDALEHAIEGVPAVRLLRMTWLLKCRPGVLQRRQELPEEAFLPPEELRDVWEDGRRGGPDRVLPVIVVTACWDTHGHPDPKGVQLRLVIDALERESKKYAKESNCFGGFREMGIFWDWASLFQLDDPGSLVEQAGIEDESARAGCAEDLGQGWRPSSEPLALPIPSRTPQRPGEAPEPQRLSEEAGPTGVPEPAESWVEQSRTEPVGDQQLAMDSARGSEAAEDPERPGGVRIRQRPASIVIVRDSCNSAHGLAKPWSTIERRAFDYAVSETMELWYAHRGTTLLAVTQHPRKRGSLRQTGYEESGWANFERMAAEQIQKPKRSHARWDAILELRGEGKTKTPHKRWPLGLEDFEELADKLGFAQQADRDTVKALYRRLSTSQLGNARELAFKDRPEMRPEDARRLGGCLRMCDNLEELRLNNCKIDGESILAAMCGRLEEDSLPKLRFLSLCQNCIADGGLQAIASAAVRGAMPVMRELWLSINRIGCPGVQALAEAGAKGALEGLTQLALDMNCIGDTGMKAFCQAVARGAFSNLTGVLFLGNNQLGDEAAQAIAGAAAKGAFSHLKKIALNSNDIGDPGAQALAGAAAKGCLADLAEMDLSRNRIGDGGALAIARAISAGRMSNDYRRLYVIGNSISPQGEQALERAQRKEGVPAGCCAVL